MEQRIVKEQSVEYIFTVRNTTYSVLPFQARYNKKQIQYGLISTNTRGLSEFVCLMKLSRIRINR